MEKTYILPPGWKVLYSLSASPFDRGFVILAKRKNTIRIFRFDGIEEYPTRIEQYEITRLEN